MTGKWPTLRGLIRAVRGSTHWTMVPYEEALADFNRALELNPKDASALVGRGRIYWAIRRDDEALADLSRALELSESDNRSIPGTPWRWAMGTPAPIAPDFMIAKTCGCQGNPNPS